MQYDLTLNPNGAQRIEASGKFFKYATGLGKIRVTTSKGQSVDLMPGQGVFGEAFTSLTIQDKTGGTNIGTLLAGDFDFRDDTVTGTVQALDGTYKRTADGRTFMGNAQAPASGNSTVSVGHITNPSNSGINVYITAMKFYQQAQNVLTYFGAHLFIGQKNGTVNQGGAACANKRAGGAVSNALVGGINTPGNTQNSAASYFFLGATDGNYTPAAQKLSVLQFPALKTAVGLDLPEPIMLPPGTQLVWTPYDQSISCDAYFTFREDYQ
jgi:hypothetical protein